MRNAILEAQRLVGQEVGVALEAADWAPVPDKKLGDFAIPCFKIAKAKKMAPAALAAELAVRMAPALGPTAYLRSASNVGPYLNFFAKTEKLFADYRQALSTSPQSFGSSQLGAGKSLCIDYSSPNVAKEIGLHHLRSTAIGDALARIAEHQGFRVARLNYLGDWGTTHGKLICALKMFGDESQLQTQGLGYMLDLYVRFNREEKDHPQLSLDAKAAFKQLEAGDPDCRRIWKLFRDISIEEFKKLYAKLGIHYDHFDGESLYEGKIEGVMKELREKIGTRISDGAEVLDLPNFKTPVLLRKDDGASLYITRDIAAAEDRFQRFGYDESWYVVAVQQKLHFEQLFKIIELLGKTYTGRQTHVSFGMLSFGSKTMKSREGNVIFLEDVLEESKHRSFEIIREKNAELPNAEAVAEMVGYGAIKFFDLSQNRNHDISFSWEKALNFDGDTAPFIQYTHARSCSLVAKAREHAAALGAPPSPGPDLAVLALPSVHQLILEMGFFEFACARAYREKDPSQVATALINIARAFNHFYHSVRVKDQTEAGKVQTLIELSEMTALVLKTGLGLLGIGAPDRM